MIGGLTYTEFAQLMRDFEKNCTEEEIAKAWAIWCRDHEAPRTFTN